MALIFWNMFKTASLSCHITVTKKILEQWPTQNLTHLVKFLSTCFLSYFEKKQGSQRVEKILRFVKFSDKTV